jgi:hypothetical protein
MASDVVGLSTSTLNPVELLLRLLDKAHAGRQGLFRNSFVVWYATVIYFVYVVLGGVSHKVKSPSTARART